MYTRIDLFQHLVDFHCQCINTNLYENQDKYYNDHDQQKENLQEYHWFIYKDMDIRDPKKEYCLLFLLLQE